MTEEVPDVFYLVLDHGGPLQAEAPGDHAHVLGQALDATIGAKITIGPPLQDRFYYDSYLGEGTLEPTVLKQLDAKAKKLCKERMKRRGAMKSLIYHSVVESSYE